ncbi:unnamed protein product [Prorocentrum cordatum]|uniref:PARP n=1 Tax=Prorocentrum cordatum TaxID=2364126 RepID=A0ABN9PQ43_9DINO|nr:unnamed protein product [Polarella glacialis]
MGPHLQQIKSELDQFRPDLVMCASKGGAYVVGLWEAGLWLGPTLMINAHPTCVRLPRGVPVVLAAGGDDEHYPSTRKALHRLVATGTASHSFLYYAAGSGPRLPPGFAPRPGDRHNMDSLLQNDCLPRLMDAALCPEGAEVHLWPPGPTRTHAALGSESRLRAERPLREALLQRLDAAQRRGAAAWPAPSVEPGSQEFGLVAAAFAAPPRAASAYRFRAAVPFEATRIAAVHRVEPRPDAAAAALRRLAELRGSLEQRGVPFEADVHARWAFYHGCGASALGAGLQHLDGGALKICDNQNMGARCFYNWLAMLESVGCWHLLRARGEARGGQRRVHGARRLQTVLMCLLASGLPCVGEAAGGGELPLRGGAVAHDCAVDSAASPELYVVPRADSAVAAYLIVLA